MLLCRQNQGGARFIGKKVSSLHDQSVKDGQRVCDMRIIVVNKFYYNRGGDCTATLATERILREHGHDVAVFAMDYPENLPSPWQPYFAPQADFGGSAGQRLRALGRLFSPSDVRRAFVRLLDDFRPDLVHLNNIHSYLSPVVAEAAHAKGVRVVWTMHDYKAVCPSYLCLRGGQVCTECMGGTFGVVRHRCMKGSLLQSTFAWLESLWWNRKRLARAADRLIAPSEFVRQMLLKGGFAAGQVVTVQHCVPRRPGGLCGERGDYYCYVGRLSREKGVATLIAAAKDLPHKLLVIGDGPMRGELEAMAGGCGKITFCGHKDWQDLSRSVGRARFLVMPSECLETFGLVNIEAECLGTPVLAADIGGIPETLAGDGCGLLFKPGDVSDLKDKIGRMYATDFDHAAIAAMAREAYSEERYYSDLMSLYRELTGR